MMDNCREYGAVIERGIVASISDGKYVVRSISRYGIVTPPLKTVADRSCFVGDIVYYCMFNDGHGIIIGGE